MDPILFHANHNTYRNSKNLQSLDPRLRGFLLEHVICSHITRLRRGSHLYYYLSGETEVDCLYEMKEPDNILTLQVSLSKADFDKNILDAKEALKIKGSNCKPILVIHHPQAHLEVSSEYSLIPAHLFLLLI